MLPQANEFQVMLPRDDGLRAMFQGSAFQTMLDQIMESALPSGYSDVHRLPLHQSQYLRSGYFPSGSENTGPPVGYVVDHRSPPPLNFITVPPKPDGATLAESPDGWSECLVTNEIKNKILSATKFPTPLVHPPKAHRIGPAPGKGLGIFATRDLDMGDLIYVERPLLVLPSCANHVKIECPQNWSTEQVKRALMFEWDKHCHRAFERLDPGAQEAYLSLANIHANGGCGTTLGICRTNGFGMEELADTFIDVTMFEFEAPYTAVCKEFSRANHSCCPNATRYFDLQSFAFYFSATRPIKSGEEITITYSILEDVRSVRQKDNQKHKIVCDCPACGPDFEASDKNRLDIVASVDGLAANYVTWVVDRTLPKDEVIKTSRWWIKLIESEGLQCSPYYERHLDVIHRAYIALGDEENAIKYGILLGKWHKALGEFKPPIASFSDPRRLRKRSDWAIRKA